MRDSKRFWLMALLLYVSLYKATSQTSIENKVTEVIDNLLEKNNYDKRLRPNYYGLPDNISVSMIIVSFGKVREVDMDFTVDMFLIQYWKDRRLRHNLSVPINLTGDFTKDVWIPDTFFLNIKEAKFHVVPTFNNRVEIQPDGNVLYSARFTLTASCEMDLRKYPLDKQSCQLILLSYSYPTSEVDYSWKEVDVMDDTMTEFELTGTSKTKKVYPYITGDWTQIYVTFDFNRRFGYVFIQAYAPIVLIVVLSWLSFWVSPEAVPARIALGITTVLTTVTLMGSFRTAVPKVSYVKALDLYFIVSFLSVFGVMLEYVAVMMNNQSRKENCRVVNESSQGAMETELSTLQETRECEEIEMQRNSSKSRENKIVKRTRNFLFAINEANPIDKAFRFICPLAFIFFNIIYWSYYLTD